MPGQRIINNITERARANLRAFTGRQRMTAIEYENAKVVYNASIIASRGARKETVKEKRNYLGILSRRFKKFRDKDETITLPLNYGLLSLYEFIRKLMPIVHGKRALLTIGEINYGLSDASAYRLVELLKAGAIEEEDARESDVEFIMHLQQMDEVTLSVVPHYHVYNRHAGAFFKHLNKTPMFLRECGIFQIFQVLDYEDTCLVYAFLEAGMEENKVISARQFIKSRDVPLSALPELCKHLGIQIQIKRIGQKNASREVYGCSNEVYNIGLVDGHYFINKQSDYTAFASKNWKEIHHLPKWGHIYRGSEGKYKRDANRCASTFEIVSILIENKAEMLEEITVQNSMVASTQYYDRVSDAITDLSFSDLDFKPVVEIEKIKKNKDIIYENLYFDFETYCDSSGKHIPYLCCLETENGEKRSFVGLDCGLKMLKSLNKDTRLIAHNANYDHRFLLKDLSKITTIGKGNKMMSCQGNFFNLKLQIKDSYHLIASKLADFPSMFGGSCEKEVMPYRIYNIDTVTAGVALIQDALDLLPEKDHAQFLANLEKWSLTRGAHYDLIEYSRRYCEIDCQVLRHGYQTFKKWMLECVNIDIDDVLTLPSLAHRYFKNMGVYDDIWQLSGTPQRFIQKCVVGGRVMPSRGVKNRVSKRLADFDAVSLYPSAMNRMPGYLQGKPKIIENWDEVRSNSDGYFVEVKVTSLKIHRDFPLLSYLDPKTGVRIFGNDMVGKTVFIDKIMLEDACEHQGCEFEFIRGYHFNNGFNPKIKEIINHLFQSRVKKQAEGNPIQLMYKLIMNAAYGKAIMKAVTVETRFFEDADEFNTYLSRNYSWVKSFTRLDGCDKIRLESVNPIQRHFNIAQVGVSVLSWSKRIMNEVMCLAEDNGMQVYYQDTDSMHIEEAHIPKLAEMYKEKHRRDLIGKGMGQFHSDFDFRGHKDVVAVESVFLGKKAYCDKLEGTCKTTGEKHTSYHVRMKGIPGPVVDYTWKKEGYADVLAMYSAMYTGTAIDFDLTCGGARARFKMNKNGSCHTLVQFNRRLKF